MVSEICSNYYSTSSLKKKGSIVSSHKCSTCLDLQVINFYLLICADIFVGQLKSELKFVECGHRSVTFDPFWDLSLPIPKVRKLIY